MSESDTLDIRPAREADTALILTLIKELAEYERLDHQALATADMLRLSLFGAQPAAEAVIAWVGSSAAGFALYFHNFSTFVGKRGLYLEDLFVRPEFRGRSIGKALLRYLARLALDRDCGRFEWAVLDWNRSARDFYESLGAEANGAWVNYRIAGPALQQLARPDPPEFESTQEPV